ncbi:universal stress protein [Actinokineospora sp. NBRC 105648]|uniref:universal stress protein n=1 Tax=Actinokineospora sp. NBRC 105648 TaxID=3032206 RepID=UPI0024A015B6|nr:universal stress protein [Actinokineospora sp. NBRC 105648]GLZ40742.1 universal stress protein [Actinokineospora sp. NBRC 105648]
MKDTMSRPPVVAGVDGSVSAHHAALWAATEAAHRQVPLRLLHAVDIAAYAHAGGFGAPHGFFEAVEADGQRMLGALREELLAVHPTLQIDTELLAADAVPALVSESAKAGLVVLGSRGLGGFSGILVGSTAVALTAQGQCPVAVIRGRTADEAPPTDGPVVVGVDGTPTSEPALATAFEHASTHDAELVAVHAWTDFETVTAHTYANQFDVDWDAMENSEREVLAERLAGWQEKYPDVTVNRVVSRDRPVRALLAGAEDARLLVVGSRGHGGFTGMLHGSTSQALIYHAPCPLLVVHSAR